MIVNGTGISCTIVTGNATGNETGSAIWSSTDRTSRICPCRGRRRTACRSPCLDHDPCFPENPGPGRGTDPLERTRRAGLHEKAARTCLRGALSPFSFGGSVTRPPRDLVEAAEVPFL